MKKIAAKIKNAWQKASSLLAPDVLHQGLAGLLGARPAFRPIPVRAERIVRHK